MGHDVLTYEENHLFPRVLTKGRMGQKKYIRFFEDQCIKVSPNIETFAHRDLINLVKLNNLDFILVTSQYIPPNIVKLMKEIAKVKVAIWCPDSMVNFGRQYIFASDFDAMFFKDPFIVNFISKKLGKKVYYLPECCNPKWHKKVELSAEEKTRYGCDITIACNMYPYRVGLLEQFSNYNFKIWGNFPAWLDSNLRQNFQGEFVAEENKAKAYNGAKIVLNTIHYTEIEGVNARVFEAAGCGAFQIVDKRLALTDLFEEGKEIVIFETKEELKEKVDYYLSHNEERKKISEASYKRAHAEHTYTNRLYHLLTVLFNKDE